MLVLNSGHMVPMDLPMISLEMITRFMNNQPFYSGISSLGEDNNKALIECLPPNNYYTDITNMAKQKNRKSMQQRQQRKNSNS